MEPLSNWFIQLFFITDFPVQEPDGNITLDQTGILRVNDWPVCTRGNFSACVNGTKEDINLRLNTGLSSEEEICVFTITTTTTTTSPVCYQVAYALQDGDRFFQKCCNGKSYMCACGIFLWFVGSVYFLYQGL